MPAYVAPKFKRAAFTCPHCTVYAQQQWEHPLVRPTSVSRATCLICGYPSIWFEENMVFPLKSRAPLPNPDLPADVKADYMEARSIAATSPRGAAALLRLCVQKLCIALGEKGKRIDDDIASLVGKGLDERVQQMLDSVRVIGNESVHPGQIDLRDDPELAATLFWLVNEIADEMITKPNRITKVYGTLPQHQRDRIVARNAKALAANGTAPTTS